MRSHTNEINRAQSFRSDLQQGIEFVGPSGNFCRDWRIDTHLNDSRSVFRLRCAMIIQIKLNYEVNVFLETNPAY